MGSIEYGDFSEITPSSSSAVSKLHRKDQSLHSKLRIYNKITFKVL